jgi:uncharacterized NAD(P)/FAD-binding protein YdhS
LEHVVIVGAGASGVLTAVHLLRQGERRIALIGRDKFSRGLAYTTRYRSHVLNVPVGSMSALPENADHFHGFASRLDPTVERSSFVPRMSFGDYLGNTLDWAETSGGRLRRVAGEVVAIDRGAGDRWRVRLGDGTALDAREVVLALGNALPRTPVHSLSALPATYYAPDPWDSSAFADIPHTAPVLLIGSGLTAIDASLALSERGHAGGVIALSRHGLLPQDHRPAGAPAVPVVPAPSASTLRGLVREVREQLRLAELAGDDWRDVLNSLRRHTPAMWRGLPIRDRRRFLRHLARRWEVHRHRMAPQVRAAVDGMLSSGWLQIIAGSLLEAIVEREGVTVRYRPRGSSIDRSQTVRVARVINCTGPNESVRGRSDSLLQSLIDSGEITPHPLDLGLACREDGALYAKTGEVTRGLWTIGPLRRGESWETTAVPEIREQASHLATAIGERIRTRS